MTRSSQSGPSPRSVAAKRAERQNPHPKGKGRAEYNNNKKFISAPQVDDGTLQLTDADVYDFQAEFAEMRPTPEDFQPPSTNTASLLDFARPAKKRKPVKAFPAGNHQRNVESAAQTELDVSSFYVPSTCGDGDIISLSEGLEDDGSFYVPSTIGDIEEEEEWERISDEQSLDNKSSYSAALRDSGS